jgi:hypothetical protein
MLNLSEKGVGAFGVLLLCGSLFAQDQGGFATQIQTAQAERDSLARLDSQDRLDSLAKQDSIANAIADTEGARQDSIAAAEAAAKAAAVAAAAPVYPYYEAYLDSVEAYVRNLLPSVESLDSAKRAASEETLKPKSDYETQAAYDQRAAGFGKAKEQKIASLEKEYFEKEKGISYLVFAAVLKEDIQPNWGSLLQKNADADEYRNRMDTLSYRISDARIKISQLNKQLSRLILKKGDSVKIVKNLQEKNSIYISRLEKAGVLMQDYILQENVTVLRTERKKVDMSLGAYDVEKQEFDLNMHDIYSEKYPFDYTGKIKIPTAQAEIIDRKTDDFTVSIDYINYPFIINDGKIFPGAKKAYVFYKEQEFHNTGVFKNVSGFENQEGYLEWAMHADSLISGKLLPKNLDASYVMQKTKYKEDTGPGWWNASRVVRTIAFTLSAASLGVAIWQNSKVDSKIKDMKKTFDEAESAITNNKHDTYSEIQKDYNNQKSELRDAENLRNIFYISAGTYGLIGMVSFFF